MRDLEVAKHAMVLEQAGHLARAASALVAELMCRIFCIWVSQTVSGLP